MICSEIKEVHGSEQPLARFEYPGMVRIVDPKKILTTAKTF